MIDIAQLWAVRQAVRTRQPLVYNITNTVVTNFTANVLLAVGASPIMSEGEQEAEELAKIAGVLVLNIGTLHPRQVDYFLKAGQSANACGTPVVFDPVGAGATSYRNTNADRIIHDIKLALIRGNYGEISFLAGLSGRVKGVDSLGGDLDTETVQGLARQTGALVAATGETDYVTDGGAVFANTTGHSLLQSVTGTGCALTSLTGAFLAVADNRQLGVLAALAFYGAAAQKAASGCKGPGTFAVQFLDALYSLDQAEFTELLKKRPPKQL
ncbi:MAG: hydroxyethylthiazole kinase [Negativicutes bacterium]|nr:hydroxyethylthiazole kinase [Negativicutes bacterium]